MRSINKAAKTRGATTPQAKLDEFQKTMMKAMRIAVKKAIAETHAHGLGAPIMRDGKLVYLMPDGSVQPVKKRRRSSRAA
jgi:hypothetical protein